MRRPNGVDLLAVAGTVVAGGWFVALLLGNKPDDGILAFAGTLLVMWATHRQGEQRRRERRRRK